MRTLPTLAVAAFISCALMGVASAQTRAPITYAGASAAPTQEERLAGGAENSYGYGAEAQRPGATIDIRRPPARTRPEAQPPQVQQVRAEAPVQAPPPQVAEQGVRPWLERERVGPPYEANGRWYVPTPEPGYEQTGEGSWYGPNFHGQATASGETYDQEAMTAAHPTLPLNSLVQVTNLENGREVIVRINDRGPFVGERLIDLSRAAAEVLGFEQAGRTRVHVRYLGPAPRRVNAEGASVAPAPAPDRRVARVEEEVAEGPVSLLPEPTEAAPAPAFRQAAYTPAAAAYVVQVGAFSDLTNAHRVRDAVGAAGPVQVDVRQTASGGELFRVRVGPWQTREEAEAARSTLANLGYPEAVVAHR